jgi:hypothetical protein
MTTDQLKIEYWPLARLVPYARELRKQRNYCSKHWERLRAERREREGEGDCG